MKMGKIARQKTITGHPVHAVIPISRYTAHGIRNFGQVIIRIIIKLCIQACFFCNSLNIAVIIICISCAVSSLIRQLRDPSVFVILVGYIVV